MGCMFTAVITTLIEHLLTNLWTVDNLMIWGLSSNSVMSALLQACKVLRGLGRLL